MKIALGFAACSHQKMAVASWFLRRILQQYWHMNVRWEKKRYQWAEPLTVQWGDLGQAGTCPSAWSPQWHSGPRVPQLCFTKELGPPSGRKQKKFQCLGTLDHVLQGKSQLLCFWLLLFSKAWILLDRDLVVELFHLSKPLSILIEKLFVTGCCFVD